jgi:hypothetical protein
MHTTAKNRNSTTKNKTSNTDTDSLVGAGDALGLEGKETESMKASVARGKPGCLDRAI